MSSTNGHAALPGDGGQVLDHGRPSADAAGSDPAQEVAADGRDQWASSRDTSALRRDAAADRQDSDLAGEARDVAALLVRAEHREADALTRDRLAADREEGRVAVPLTPVERDAQSQLDREHAARDRDWAAADRADLLALRRRALTRSEAAAEDRRDAARDRAASAGDRAASRADSRCGNAQPEGGEP